MDQAFRLLGIIPVSGAELVNTCIAPNDLLKRIILFLHVIDRVRSAFPPCSLPDFPMRKAHSK